MAGKISDLTALTGANLATGDTLEVLDVSDTSLAATGTNKGITSAELGKGIYTYETLAIPFRDNATGYGVPGRLLAWGTTGMVQTRGWVYATSMIVNAAGASFDAFQLSCDTAVASCLMDIAVYSQPDYRVGTTMTKVVGTTGLSLASTGLKTPTLGATQVLSAGYYSLVWVAYNGASDPTCYGLSDVQGLNGANPNDGNHAGTQATMLLATGASSLAATLTQALNVGGGGVESPYCPIVLRRV